MVNIRGVNVYPASIESVVRGFAEVVEFRSTVLAAWRDACADLDIELAPTAADGADVAARVSQQLREALGLTVPVHVAASGSLPRFEMKARRFIVEA